MTGFVCIVTTAEIGERKKADDGTDEVEGKVGG